MQAVMVVSKALLVALVLCAPVARAQMGGSSAPPPAASEDVLPEVDSRIASDAQKVWERAEKEFADEDWLEAIAYYQHIRSKFSYNVPLAAMAELRLGDVAFEREKFAAARTHYRSFLRFHPKHEKADYAAWRVGLSSFREIPGDSWITPPAIERDQSQAKEALRQMREFQKQFPDSVYVSEARDAVIRCEDMLAEHELYVARYYAKRKKWKGTLLRAKTMVNTYPESTLAPEALLLQVEAHAQLGEAEEAKTAFTQLEARKPAESLLSKAHSAIRSMKPSSP